jgi:hypothetical protein
MSSGARDVGRSTNALPSRKGAALRPQDLGARGLLGQSALAYAKAGAER